MSEYADEKSLKANGWTLLFHPLFEAQLDELTQKVGALQDKIGEEYTKHNDTKRLAAIYRLATEVIPADPSDPNSDRATHWAQITVIGIGRSFSNSIGYFFASTKVQRLSSMFGSMTIGPSEPMAANLMPIAFLRRCWIVATLQQVGLTYWLRAKNRQAEFRHSSSTALANCSSTGQ
jgi:hypothetical protein